MKRLNLFNLTWGVGLVLTPLVFRLSESLALRAGKDIFFYFIFVLMAMFSIKTIKINKEIKYCVIFMAIQAFWVTTDFTMFLFWYQLQMFLAGLCVFYLVCTNKISKTFIFNCICTAGTIQASWCILQYFDVKVMENMVKFIFYWSNIGFIDAAPLDLGGSMGNSNLSGALISLTLPVFFRKKWVYVIPVILIGVYLTGSAMALLTVIGSFLYLGYNKYFNNRHVPFIGFAITAFIFIFWGEYFGSGFLSGNHRYEVWEKTIMLTESNGLYLGQGLGHFAHFFSQYFKVGGYKFMQIHNEYLEVFYAFGLIGLGVVLYIINKTISLTRDNILLCGMFASCINCFGNFTMHISATAFIVISYFAMAINGGRDDSILEW